MDITPGTGAGGSDHRAPPVEGAKGTTSCKFLEDSCNSSESLGAALPTSKAEWLLKLTEVSSLVELGCKLAWGLKAGFLQVGFNRARAGGPFN